MWGALALPLYAQLYVRRKDVPRLPPRLGWPFRTKLELAAELVKWAAHWVHTAQEVVRVVVDDFAAGFGLRCCKRPSPA
jgi:hypothetical protein